MAIYDLERWIKENCESTSSPECGNCPYAYYDDEGSRKCERKMYYQCEHGYDEDRAQR